MAKVLMVCTANLCRSPMAEIVARTLATRAGVGKVHSFESAGTRASPYREPPDPRAVGALVQRGYPPGKGRSRRITEKDFAQADLILPMDHSNMGDLRRLCPNEHVHKLRMFLEFAPATGLMEMPDPYFGAAQGFERVLDLCEAGAQGLIAHLRFQG
jgi:protein-tyrosine phosphatase